MRINDILRVTSLLLLSTLIALFSSTQSYAQTEQAEAFCPGDIPETAAEEDFALMPNGEMLHIASNLIFMRCSIGQTWSDGTCTSEPSQHTWQQALALSLETTYNDSRNWRLPNVKELSLITERACVRPAINDEMFPNTSPDDYWTSTPSMLNESSAWAVSFANASNAIKQKDRSLFVRLVRTRIASDVIP